jgi:ATP-dependent 26S proteasome regulatory subunit
LESIAAQIIGEYSNMQMIISDIPEINEDRDLLSPRISTAINDMLEKRYNIRHPRAVARFTTQKADETFTSIPSKRIAKDDDEKSEDVPPIALRDPQFTFDQLVLDDATFEELRYAINFERVRDKVYVEWGLERLEPSPKLALNFWGAAGTGKTMAAQALAQKIGKKIILASYAEIESKYHGDGPKNVKRLFQFASDNDAVLFIDEADSLLSKRLTNVTQGSEQAINSMRSQLLIQIEQFSGMVIFATNLASNYDSAFITRIKSIQFKLPDKDMRKRLWNKMLLPSLPLDKDIDCEKLSEIEGICGRDIKNAVVKAALKTAIDGIPSISQQILEFSINSIIESNRQVTQNGNGVTLAKTEKDEIGKKIKLQLRKEKYKRRRHLS